MSEDKNLGMGVMIGMLGGNKKTVEAVQYAIGKKIKSVALESDNLLITLEDDTVLKLMDDGQSCCERRWMTCDDDLSYFTDCELLNIEIKDAPAAVEDENKESYDVYECQFLEVTTSKGSFQCANHNDHNGYYGGFWITATLSPTPPEPLEGGE